MQAHRNAETDGWEVEINSAYNASTNGATCKTFFFSKTCLGLESKYLVYIYGNVLWDIHGRKRGNKFIQI